MTINGEKLEFKELKFSELLKQRGLEAKFVALELNGEVISRDKFESLVLKENDKAELVNFVGGG
ncbi:sulfur carrier protein ThiS [Campylobacter avium]|uniref:sulfur carrier protein ThiS n=1 Tax=Campylobacter avium TaxID=522485 RepID=UPI001DBC5745|nr:sulfur carrier protein ThiS [Campylobacter avium]HJE66752.1 sulfur carrier protein ThiS [Campylobacter avium]